MTCEVCGKMSSIHVTEIDGSSGTKQEHHYCWDHAPAGINRPSPDDDLKTIDKMIAAVQAKNLTPDEKAAFIDQLEQLRQDIRAGRRRLGDGQ